MVQCILKDNGKIVPCHSPILLKAENIYSKTEQNKRKSFGRLIKGK